LKDEKLGWVAAVIIDIKSEKMGVLKIELAKIGYDQQFNEIITITKDNLDDI